MVQKFECYVSPYPAADYLVEIISTTAKRSALAEDIRLRSAANICASGTRDVKVFTSLWPTQDHEDVLQAVSNNPKRAPPTDDVNRRIMSLGPHAEEPSSRGVASERLSLSDVWRNATTVERIHQAFKTPEVSTRRPQPSNTGSLSPVRWPRSSSSTATTTVELNWSSELLLFSPFVMRLEHR